MRCGKVRHEMAMESVERHGREGEDGETRTL